MRRIKPGDELRLRTTGATLEAIGNETNSGEVFVISAGRAHPFYIAANMVEIVETKGSTENEIS